MTKKNAPPAHETPKISTWGDSVASFEAEATWLTAADAPALMAMRALAVELDAGNFQAALVSQFTMCHQRLMARRPGGSPAPKPDADDNMFDIFGGKAWTADG